MDDGWRHWSERLWLPKGEPVLIRHIQPSDVPLMVAFHASLSEQSVYLRYFTPLELSRRVDHLRLYRVCHADGKREVVLVVEWRQPETDAPAIVGVGRLTRCEPPDEESGEVAMIISDAHQQKGIGRALLQRLLWIARQQGRRRVLAFMLAENQGMLHLCATLGFHNSFDATEGFIRATLEL
jgi:acetyltransferase